MKIFAKKKSTRTKHELKEPLPSSLKVKNKTKEKTAYLLVLLIIIICVSVIWVLYNKVELFTKTTLMVKNVEIIGASSKVKIKLTNNFSSLLEQPMVDVNLAQIKAEILQMPWFLGASVRRSYPNTIQIKVIERKPILIWENDDDEFYIINSEDKILRKAKVTEYKELILIKKGKVALAQSDDIRFVIYKNFDLLNRISKLEFNQYQWNVYLNNGIVIKLPEHNIDKAVDSIIKANLKYKLFDRDINYIDARIPNKLFVMPNLEKST